METYSKDIVKKLLERATQKVKQETENEIKSLRTELEAIKLEKELVSEYNKPQPKVNDDVDIDKILGGFND